MEELKIKGSWFETIVEKIIKKIVKKKFGIDIQLVIQDLDIQTTSEYNEKYANVSAHIDLAIPMNNVTWIGILNTLNKEEKE